jgi:hypothetical protein
MSQEECARLREINNIYLLPLRILNSSSILGHISVGHHTNSIIFGFYGNKDDDDDETHIFSYVDFI